MGLELIFIKKLAGRENPFQILTGQQFDRPVHRHVRRSARLADAHGPQWALSGGIGVCMAVAQTCFVNAMARADASFVAPFSYATLIFAAIYDACSIGFVPDAVTYLGAAIILAGAFWLALREARLKNPTTRPLVVVIPCTCRHSH